MLVLVLVRKFYMCSNNVRTYCSSLYTCQLWWNYKVASIRKLYVAYNNIFRMLFGLPRDCSASNMFVQNGVNNCPAIIRNLVFKFMLRVDKSDNLIICSVLNST